MGGTPRDPGRRRGGACRRLRSGTSGYRLARSWKSGLLVVRDRTLRPPIDPFPPELGLSPRIEHDLVTLDRLDDHPNELPLREPDRGIEGDDVPVEPACQRFSHVHLRGPLYALGGIAPDEWNQPRQGRPMVARGGVGADGNPGRRGTARQQPRHMVERWQVEGERWSRSPPGVPTRSPTPPRATTSRPSGTVDVIPG